MLGTDDQLQPALASGKSLAIVFRLQPRIPSHQRNREQPCMDAAVMRIFLHGRN